MGRDAISLHPDLISAPKINGKLEITNAVILYGNCGFVLQKYFAL